MKIEMGESLFYSWLRHVKGCQIVQTNWKATSNWEFQHYDEIEKMYDEIENIFNNKYKIFKQNTSLNQIIKQGECDVLGMSLSNGEIEYYAVDVAFHESGLNYGSKEETIAKVISKSIRTAFCLYGFFNTKKTNIVFASPKIHSSLKEEIENNVNEVNQFFKNKGFDFNIRIICNEEFNNGVLQPILLLAKDIADTSELFMRAYQMLLMFKNEVCSDCKPNTNKVTKRLCKNLSTNNEFCGEDIYKELKIGQIVRTILKEILESGKVSNDEIIEMQTIEYSKRIFDIQYPLLVSADSNFDKVRYYSAPLFINGQKYYLCSQWFETSANNDRPYLLNWIKKHDNK